MVDWTRPKCVVTLATEKSSRTSKWVVVVVVTYFAIFLCSICPLVHKAQSRHNEVLGQCVDPNPLPEGMEKSKPEMERF